MKMRSLGVAALLAFIFSFSGATAQTSINATGGDASGNGGSASYTVGQVVYTTNTGTNGSVAQGVQQAYEISVVTGIEQARFIELSCSVYPNPTTDYVTLKVQNYHTENLIYGLFDFTGRLIGQKGINGSEITIPMSGLAASTYFLKILDGSTNVKTFKIVKK